MQTSSMTSSSSNCMKQSTGALQERNDLSGEDDGLVDDASLFAVHTPLLVPLSHRDDSPVQQQYLLFIFISSEA